MTPHIVVSKHMCVGCVYGGLRCANVFEKSFGCHLVLFEKFSKISVLSIQKRPVRFVLMAFAEN